MTIAAIILGLALIAVKIFLRLFLGRSPTPLIALGLIIAVPIDISFLVISLIVKGVEKKSMASGEACAWLATYVLITCIVMMLWRCTEDAFNAERHLKSGILFVVNLALASATFLAAFNLLS